jgi:plasmid stability protein
MAQLIVRNIEETLVRQLRIRAARHGRSAEAEHRSILRSALRPSQGGAGLKKLLVEMPEVGQDADFSRVPDLGRDATW